MLEASIPIRICTSQRSSMNRIGSSETRSFATTRQSYRQMLSWMRSFGELSTHRDRVRPAAMAQVFSVSCSKPGSRFSRSRRPTSRIAADVERATISSSERGPCRLCRPAYRDAAKPRRDDRIPAGSHVLPEDRGERQARRSADDPQHDRLRSRRPSDQLRSLTRMQLVRNVGLVAARSDRLSRPRVRLSYRPQISRPSLPRTA